MSDAALYYQSLISRNPTCFSHRLSYFEHNGVKILTVFIPSLLLNIDVSEGSILGKYTSEFVRLTPGLVN